MREPNYFLYVVGIEGKEEHLSIGNYGVGRTSIGPGIQDAPFGVMYIMSAEELFSISGQKNPNTDTIKRTILKFYRVG